MFAAVDEALVAFGESRTRAAREGEGKDAETAQRYASEGKAIHIRLLTGRILALVGTAVLSYELAWHLESGIWARRGVVAFAAFVYATAVGTTTTAAVARASRWALPLLRMARPLELAMVIPAAPLVWVSSLIDRMFPPRPEDDPQRVTEVVVEQLIERGEEQGAIAQDHAELLLSVLEFRETVAREVMVPRTSMIALDVETDLKAVAELIVQAGHSRYPVYRGSVDHPVGILYAKDLFRLFQDGGFSGKLEDLVRTPVFYAAESQKISDLLRQMRSRRTHLAIVADEYGGTAGMVTLEDIIEEIVGEIRDEHDPEEAAVRQIAPGRFLAKADVSVHDVAEITGLRLPEGASGYESLGGMLVDLAGRVPRSGESIELGGHDLIVRASDERRVTRVEVVERDTQIPPAA
jgi:CBS domain containing-hemolysin-like protein